MNQLLLRGCAICASFPVPLLDPAEWGGQPAGTFSIRHGSYGEDALRNDLIGRGCHVHKGTIYHEADIIIGRFIIEHDGVYFHQRPEEDRRKQSWWNHAGYYVIRVREPGLERINSSDILLSRPYLKLGAREKRELLDDLVRRVYSK